jgi:hypothetical protein
LRSQRLEAANLFVFGNDSVILHKPLPELQPTET